MFAKCHRLRRLLHYLVEKRLCGAPADTSEYAIGIEVFNRQAKSYNTGEDPIVRVQIGRLRERLRALYASGRFASEIEFFIPRGNYMPTIRRATGAPAASLRHDSKMSLALLPLTCISDDRDGMAFTRGLNEELGYQLFLEFGDRILPHGLPAAPQHATAADYVLQGSLRFGMGLARLSVRLLETATGRMAWSTQFDRQAPFGISQQEDLASVIRNSLAGHFNTAAAVPRGSE